MCDSNLFGEGNAPTRCQTNDWISWNGHLAKEAIVTELTYTNNSVFSWRSCLCESRGIESQHGVRLPPAAFSGVSYVKSRSSGTSPIFRSSAGVPCPKFEQAKKHILQPVTVTKSQTVTNAIRKNDVVAVEVVSDGTKLMKKIKMPTVIVKFRNRDLQKSKVYYATLWVDTAEYLGEFPAILFSSRYHYERTEYCELLPLIFGKSKHIPDRHSLKPMLRSKGWKRIFNKGCSFKVTALKSGRLVNWSDECPWSMYDLRVKELRSLLRSFISRDIREMPTEIIETLVPSNKLKRKYKCYKEKEKLESGGLSYDELNDIWLDIEKKR